MTTAFEYGQGERTLTTAAGMVAEAKQDFDRQSGQLTDQIAGLRGRWQGQGARAFFDLQAAWAEKHRTIVGALDRFEESLRSTERDNLTTDETQSANYLTTAGRLDAI